MADKPVNEVVAVDAALAALVSPTSSDVYEALAPFSNDAAVASTASLALSGAASPGGSQPVSCVIQVSNQDIASATTYYVLYGTDGEIIDNWIDQNQLEALPDGIGLELGADNLTTTEAGVWALTLDYSIPADITWDGFISLDNFSNVTRAYIAQPATKQDSLCEIVSLPSGAQIATRVDTNTPATGLTLMMHADLSIVRLA